MPAANHDAPELCGMQHACMTSVVPKLIVGIIQADSNLEAEEVPSWRDARFSFQLQQVNHYAPPFLRPSNCNTAAASAFVEEYT